ncbi:MAG: DUF1624 domain-containing protein [Oscillospiraceae bacterium]|nr:DUF1624 domain-containing protein [Oscillospiraceae bacterium]
MEQAKQRIELMDAARGLSLILMVFYHFFYDLVVFAGAPRWIFRNVVFDPLQYFFAGLFILISGVSSNFSHSNALRGLKTLGVALVITLATTLMDMPIVFGILHFLGTCMLLYGLTQRFWQTLGEKASWAVPALCLAGIVLTARFANGYPTETPYLWMFGLVTPAFESADYFPLLPWMFVFLLGTWAGKYVRERRLPKWFYETKVPFLPAVGRSSLLIYVLHQPVLYGLTMLGIWIFGKG